MTHRGEHQRYAQRDEHDRETIPTDPQIVRGERTGRRGISGGPETPGGSSRPIESTPEDHRGDRG